MIQKVAFDLERVGDIVGHNIADFVEEMRAVDVGDLISFVRFECFPTVEDLVNSSTELFFQPDMLVFSWAAGVELRWDTLPAVTLGLEFRHPEVSVFFNLTLRNAGESVEILAATFDRPRSDPLKELARAFTEARLPSARPPSIAVLRQGAVRPTRKGLPWP